MDITPFLHALCAVAAQLLIGLFTGNWAYGAIAGCTFFIAREHTQAEYRWIEMFGHGKRMNMPWWGGFDPRAWDVASLVDFCRWRGGGRLWGTAGGGGSITEKPTPTTPTHNYYTP